VAADAVNLREDAVTTRINEWIGSLFATEP
jgi:hypothetical protein